jgi:hypothetical protein
MRDDHFSQQERQDFDLILDQELGVSEIIPSKEVAAK